MFNHTLTKVLMDITSKEAWSKIKPNVSYFKMFGCKSWAHILCENHKAMEPKSEQCIFVVYFEDVKAYRLFVPHTLEVIFW